MSTLSTLCITGKLEYPGRDFYDRGGNFLLNDNRVFHDKQILTDLSDLTEKEQYNF